ncbi:hypothetical protein Bca52824_073488 [Brassica carinata]|uniref:Uncharacterized protein n=1 Tax=Brassica carinata TaxID=52824 RepID=A0A8X7QFG8_BRACI|nr:hypothetical protein Bca52824_073488 [Brassica carinata]
MTRPVSTKTSGTMTYSSSASIRRRNRDHAGEPPARFLTFESRLEESRWCFISNEPVANPWSLHHVTEEIFCKYQQLCIRGFLVQGILLLDYPAIAEARRMVEDVGLIYTVLHVRPIYLRVVREFISNLCSADDRVYIRGCRFDFYPVVINQQFMTPFVEKSHVWEDEDLTQAIVFLTKEGSCFQRENVPPSLVAIVPFLMVPARSMSVLCQRWNSRQTRSILKRSMHTGRLGVK